MVLENLTATHRSKKGCTMIVNAPFFKALAIWMLIQAAMACGKDSDVPAQGNPNTPVAPAKPIIPLPAGWKVATSYNSGLPEGMQVLHFDSTYAGRFTRAFAVVYDSKVSFFEFKPVLSATAKKPSSFYSEEPGVVLACINGGYFGSNQSYSLVKYNQSISSANIKVVNRTYQGTSTPYYPTRAAFGINASGLPEVAWIYHTGPGNNEVYQYPAPSPNAEGAEPQPIPTSTFPAGGSLWNPVSAIGGSPMLLVNNQIRVTSAEELISVNNTTSRPRSAIGYTAAGMVIMLAVEGDNTANGYAGLNLNELAQMLQSLGCSHAINLDGGGSTSMVVGNKLTVKPGDNGVERPVVSAILLKRK